MNKAYKYRIYPTKDQQILITKICNCCGNKVKSIPLGQRIYSCEKCGTVIDRDYNAALNIKDEGLRILIG